MTKSVIIGAVLIGVLVLVAVFVLPNGEADPEVPPENGNGEQVAQAEYTGSDACQGCHSEAYAGWLQTEHPYMIQEADEIWPEAAAALEEALADPESEFVEIGRDLGRIDSLDEIQYVVGQRWKQRFVVKTEEGFAFLQSQYYPLGADGPGLYVYGASRIYEDRCLACHATGFDLEAANNLDRTADDYRLESVTAELGVGCEACHGPGSIHAGSPAADNIQNPRDHSTQAQNDFCGFCHARNNGHVELEGREDPVGYQVGGDLRDVTRPLSLANGENVWRMVIDDETEGYYDREEEGSMRFFADGAARSHRMAYNDLEQNNEKFAAMSCIDCHNPHSENSLTADSFDELCGQCHDETFDIDEIMPLRAMSSNTPDIRTHTFFPGGVGNPNDDIIPMAVPPSDID
ncbi:cytochrome c3 family protein [Dethiobacter alkaliphilus]|uniref:cytochrome c3 family protein n=1 Tax=Dethiobacter alkaliphilus TaxID=427926 RepID=UPI0022262075|nr:cytochrome c3 family protein [Dethiobacter alkaliphilus]MCW3491125.1 multiheme c-type cytochrome [Dethiobacter alkaliphilus]